jgi:tetratricopeptide (TPR) repeat protein
MTSAHPKIPPLHVLLCVVAVVTVAAHAGAIRGPFVFDDIFEIESNPQIRTLWPPWRAMTSPGGYPARPLAYLSFALNYAAHGLEPLGWHAVNIAIHLCNGCGLWACVDGILRSAKRQAEPLSASADGMPLAGLATAALWLVHPLTTQPVAYIYQRMELLGAAAILGCLFCFLRSQASSSTARSNGWLAAAVAVSAIGMLCKETAVVAPCVILATDWLLFCWRADRPWRSLATAVARRPRFYAALAATWAVAGLVILGQRSNYRELVSPLWSVSDYALNQPRVVLHYLSLAALPVGQCFDYGWRASRDPAVLAPGIAALAAATLLAVKLVWSRPLGALAIGLFFLLLAPTSSLMPVNDLCVEHRMYLPVAVPLAAAVVGVAAATGRWRSGPWLNIGLITALLAAYVVIDVSRTRVYASMTSLWSDTASKAPHNQRALLWKGISLDLEGRTEEAFDAFAATIAVDPSNPACARAHTFRAVALGRAGRLEAAIAEARRAVELAPKDGLCWVNLGQGLFQSGDLPAAEMATRTAIDRSRGRELQMARLNLARIMAAGGRADEARELCLTILREDPACAAALDLGRSLPPGALPPAF